MNVNKINVKENPRLRLRRSLSVYGVRTSIICLQQQLTPARMFRLLKTLNVQYFSNLCGRMSEISVFPELWELIFDELTPSELLGLTLVCKTFKGVIENSCKLMRKIVVTLNAENCSEDCLRKSTRRYQRVKVDGVHEVAEGLENFLSRQSRSIEELKIVNSSLTLCDLDQLFRCVADDLEVLAVCDLKLFGSCDRPQNRFLTLRKLHIMATIEDNTGIDVLNLIDGREILEISCFSRYEVEDSGIESLSRFLTSLVKLKSLCLVGNFTEKLMQTFSPKHEFSLKSLWLELSGDAANEDLRKLLETQTTSLQFVNLGKVRMDDELLASIRSIKSLQSLRLDDCTFKFIDDRRSSPAISQLFLSKINTKQNEDEVCQLLRSSFVERLSLASMTIPFNVAICIAYEMPNLNHLTIGSCRFHPVTFPFIKKLTLVGSQREEMVKAILVNRSIEELGLESKYRSDSIVIEALGKLRNVSINYFD